MIIPFRVAVGSTNPVKVRAVETVMKHIFPDAEIIGVDVPSDVSEQPIGVEETKQGAINRAQAALQSRQADWAFGLEAGVIYDEKGICWLGGVVAAVDSEGNISTSSEFPLALPHEVGLELREGGELGPIIDRLTGLTDTKKGLGAIGFLTGGLITREESWRSKIVYAATPFLHEELYGEVRTHMRNKTIKYHLCEQNQPQYTEEENKDGAGQRYPIQTQDTGQALFPFYGRTLDVFQNFHIWLDEQKQFDQDPILNTTLLSIEVGELGKEIAKAYLKAKRSIAEVASLSPRQEFDLFQDTFQSALTEYQTEIGNELADCLAYVLKLANYTGIDLEDAYINKMVMNIQRTWN